MIFKNFENKDCTIELNPESLLFISRRDQFGNDQDSCPFQISTNNIV